MRLIDADLVGDGLAVEWQKALVKAEITDAPTIDPKTLPIVRQLRDELEKVTAERNIYKIFFNDVTACGDCNDCGNLKTCKYKPRIGETTCFNCPFWSKKVALPACGDIISAVKAAEKIAFAKQTSIPRDQWQDAAEVME